MLCAAADSCAIATLVRIFLQVKKANPKPKLLVYKNGRKFTFLPPFMEKIRVRSLPLLPSIRVRVVVRVGIGIRVRWLPPFPSDVCMLPTARLRACMAYTPPYIWVHAPTARLPCTVHHPLP